MKIDVLHVTKQFGQFTALSDIHLQVPSGELVALLGPSGSGKTTLLRIIAGLEFADAGTIHFDGAPMSHRTPRERHVGFVFQHYALFRHMTVFENVAFGLRVRPKRFRPGESDIRRRVHKLLQLVQMERLGPRYPTQLSGGQRQRVALARALAVEPKVLLLDEPFGSLDAQVRQELRRWLRRLHDEIHITSLLVTHDQEEALEVADRVVVMNHGRVEQVGSPADVYHEPATPFVYNFLGNVNLFHGRVEGNKTFLSETPESTNGRRQSDPKSALVYVRPHLLDIDLRPSTEHHLKAVIKHINTAGPLVKIEALTASGDSVHVELSQERYQELQLQKDHEVFLAPKEFKVFMDYQI